MTKITCDRCGKPIPYNHGLIPNYDTLRITRIDSGATEVLGPIETSQIDLCAACQAYIFGKILYDEEATCNDTNV